MDRAEAEVIVLGALAAGGARAHGVTLSVATIVIVVLIVIAAAPLIRHRRATAGAGRPSRARTPAKIKRSDYYWQSRNLAHRSGGEDLPGPALGASRRRLGIAQRPAPAHGVKGPLTPIDGGKGPFTSTGTGARAPSPQPERGQGPLHLIARICGGSGGARRVALMGDEWSEGARGDVGRS